MRFCNGRTRSRSVPGMSPSLNSTTDTADPSASYTQAISRPMMPPPTTSSRLPSSGNSSAPVESMMRGSSGNPGRRTDSDPAAMMHCLKSTRRTPSRRAQFQRIRSDENRLAAQHVDFALLCEHAEAVGQLAHDLVLPAAQLRAIDLAAARKTIPQSAMSAASSMTLAACSRALEGMQPTFRHTPPSTGQRSMSVTLSPRSAARKAAV